MNSIVALTCLIYEEDLQTDFSEVLLYFPVAISPLHNLDIYDTDTKDHARGEIKKAHYHVVFSSNLNVKQRRIFCQMLGVKETTYFQRVQNGEGILKYLTHETEKAKNQGKHIYSKDDIQISETFNEDLLKTVGSDDYISRMVSFIVDKNFTEYCIFMQELLKTEDDEFIKFCFKNELKCKHLIDSLRYERLKNSLDN